jgi:hypothetical protein
MRSERDARPPAEVRNDGLADRLDAAADAATIALAVSVAAGSGAGTNLAAGGAARATATDLADASSATHVAAQAAAAVETGAVHRAADVAELQDLRNLGVSLAVDDFGTGYASLDWLCLQAFDEIKIDSPSVPGPGRDGTATAVTSSILALAQLLALNVIAEGSETQDPYDLSLIVARSGRASMHPGRCRRPRRHPAAGARHAAPTEQPWLDRAWTVSRPPGRTPWAVCPTSLPDGPDLSERPTGAAAPPIRVEHLSGPPLLPSNEVRRVPAVRMTLAT